MAYVDNITISWLSIGQPACIGFAVGFAQVVEADGTRKYIAILQVCTNTADEALYVRQDAHVIVFAEDIMGNAMYVDLGGSVAVARLM